MKLPNLNLDDLCNYTPHISVGRVILDDLGDYIPKIAKGTAASIVLLTYLTAADCQPQPPDDDDDDDDTPIVIEDEAKGARLMYDKTNESSNLTATYNTENEPINFTYPEGSSNTATIVPDFFINGGNAYGEFNSKADGIGPIERAVIDAYNAAAGPAQGKMVIVDPDTSPNIKNLTKQRLEGFGIY